MVFNWAIDCSFISLGCLISKVNYESMFFWILMMDFLSFIWILFRFWPALMRLSYNLDLSKKLQFYIEHLIFMAVEFMMMNLGLIRHLSIRFGKGIWSGRDAWLHFWRLKLPFKWKIVSKCLTSGSNLPILNSPSIK